MIPVASAAAQSEVLAAVQSPDDVRISLRLDVGGEDCSERLFDGDWGQSDIAISLRGSISGILPRRLEGAAITLSVLVNGIPVPQLRGNFSAMSTNTDLSSTAIQAASSGALLPRVKLGEIVSYEGVPPEYIIQDALLRCSAPTGGYDAANFEIEAVGSPLLDFTGSKSFKPQESPKDILSHMAQDQQFSYIFSDTANNGHRATVDRGTGSTNSIDYQYNAQDFPSWQPPVRKTEQYSHVVVYKEGADNTWEYSARSDVEYRGVDTPPFANTPLLIPLSASTGFGTDVAQQLAYSQAEGLSRGQYTGTVTLPFFNPLLQSLDTARVDDTVRDDDGMWNRAWLLRVDQFNHIYSANSSSASSSSATQGVSVFGAAARIGSSTTYLTLASSVNYTATLLEEEFIRPPTLLLGGVSAGVLESIRDFYGIVDEDYMYFDVSPLTWYTVVGDELVFDSSGPVAIDGDEIVVSK